jgi:uncharacterized iron-regulated membrane protein
MTDVVPETPPPANRGLWMLVIGLGIAILLVVAIMVGMAIRRVWMPKKPEAQTTTEVAEPTSLPGEAMELNLDLEPGASVADAKLEGRTLIVRITSPTSDQVFMIDRDSSKVISRIRFNRKPALAATPAP